MHCLPGTPLPAIGFYVDEYSGLVCDTEVAPGGCHFEVVHKTNHVDVQVVADQDGEVITEAVLWPSLAALREAGVDITKRQLRVRLDGAAMGKAHFAWGQYSPVVRETLIGLIGQEIPATREGMNHYRLASGILCHIYDALEVQARA